MDEISQKINESCFLCQNIGQVLIWMILDVSKCSIYDVKHPIFLIFRWPQTPHTANYLKEFCKQSYFMKTKVPVTYWVQFVTLSGYLLWPTSGCAVAHPAHLLPPSLGPRWLRTISSAKSTKS